MGAMAGRLIAVLSGTSLRPRQTKTAPPKTLDPADRERLAELCEAILAGRAADSDLTALTKLAAKGAPWIWTVVGVAYETGNGVPQSKSLAASCYRLAAEKGDAWGQYRLGRVLVGQVRS
jgi:TPR repeat protein